MLKANELKKEDITMTAEELRMSMENHTNVSLRKIAQATDISYPVLLKASKKPIEGQVYDPDVYNFEALACELLKREIKVYDIDFEALNTKTTRDSFVVKNKDAFKVGQMIYLRDNKETPYEVIYTTETSIVIMLQGTQEPRVLSWNTLQMKGPSFEPRVAQDTPKKAKAEAND